MQQRVLQIILTAPPVNVCKQAQCRYVFFFSSRRRHTRFDCDWSSDVCSSDLLYGQAEPSELQRIDPNSHCRVRTEELDAADAGDAANLIVDATCREFVELDDVLRLNAVSIG